MNIAILLSGRTDMFEYAVHDNFTKLIQPLIDEGHNVHLHGSFWDTDDTKRCIEKYNKYWKTIDVELFTEYSCGFIKDFNEFKQCTQIYDVEYSHAVQNTLYFLYKLNRGYKIIKQYELKNEFKYDYYVRLRPDVCLDSQIDIDTIKTLDDHSIMLYVDRVYLLNNEYVGYREGWVDDNFCIATNKPFELFCSMYERSVELSHKYQATVSHILLQKLFIENKIQCIRPNPNLVMFKKQNNQINRFLLFGHTHPDIYPLKS